MRHDEFSVGEVATYWRPGSQRHGEDVTVTGGLCCRTCLDVADGSIFAGMVYPIAGKGWEPPPHGNHWVAPPDYLRKKRPPREPVGSWDHCVWKPEIELTA